ncbi:MAG TPA: SDR family NAD(P)-dependent oxidoreductase [Candidatus Brocadiaceae bacterium]|nr:SDR family oxidoreductase [Candidatus Woesearchaeota archaeon]
MNLNLDNKRVLITGASRGIGLSIAEGFLMENARVVLLARTHAALLEAAERLTGKYGQDRVLIFSADCADASNWPDVLGRINADWGGLDIAIANVGNGRSLTDALPDSEHFNKVWRTNFMTAEGTARATLPLLINSGGCLLFISSIAGIEAIGAPTDYSVAKTAIVSLSKQLARKLAPRVRVNCIAPGNVYFSGGSWDAKIKEDPKRVDALINATVPMGRFGTPEEIADAVVFLCSDRASFITGACLVVDGGQTVSLF